MKKRLSIILLALGIVGIVGFIVASNSMIVAAAKGKCFQDASLVPPVRVGLLLGTSKYLSDGRINLHYQYRIDAAFKLLMLKKVEKLIISGDNSRSTYNEPEMMKHDLMQIGASESQLVCDFAGRRTLDSIVRAKRIFGQQEILIISQHFHNERALYLAQANGITAVAFDAQDPPLFQSLRTRVREVFARAKCIVDTWVNKQPKFLGPQIQI
jgi:SanA protein